MSKQKYDPTTKAAALARAEGRGPNEGLAQIAAEYDLQLSTLKGWLKDARRTQRLAQPDSKPAARYSPAEQLQSLLITAAMDDSARSAWCRQHGLFVHQLEAWKQALSAPRTVDSTALKKTQAALHQAQLELRRKDKALAEAAALLVLQKKFQLLFSDPAC